MRKDEMIHENWKKVLTSAERESIKQKIKIQEIRGFLKGAISGYSVHHDSEIDGIKMVEQATILRVLRSLNEMVDSLGKTLEF